MSRDRLLQRIKNKESFLCIGLDTDKEKIPSHLKQSEDPLFEFNKAIIDATRDLAVAYKPNTAFYEAYGASGMESLQKTIDYIPDDILCIADAKRADIGNTSARYAEAYLNHYGAEAITVAPYMGEDSIRPFLNFPGKWVIVLALTSNPGSDDFQKLKLENGEYLYERVIRSCSSYGSADEMMFVVGATQSAYIEKIRKLVPDYFFLVPGIGAQGGDLEEVCESGLNSHVGLLVNASRSIIYADTSENFAQLAREKALELQIQMAGILRRKGYI